MSEDSELLEPKQKIPRVEYSDDDELLFNRRDHQVPVGPEDFELLTVLGTGGYGKVFLTRKVTGIDEGKLYAMKILKKTAVVRKKKVMEHTLTERSVLEAIHDFPFLVTLHYAFQTESKLHLVMDYLCGGELFTHLHQIGPFSESATRVYAAEITLALEYLHSLRILYRDIKLENILLDKDGHVVLTDFGLSKTIEPNQVAHSYCGTVEYMAPEIIRGGEDGHSLAVDWWSLGVLLHELLTCESPFAVLGESNTQKEISRRILYESPSIPSHLSLTCCNLLLGLIRKDYRTRLGAGGAHEIKNHMWFSSINWEDVLAKKLRPPFKPYFSNELDVGNFSEEFTAQTPVDSPALPITKYNEVFRVSQCVLLPLNYVTCVRSPSRVTHSLVLPYCSIPILSSILFLPFSYMIPSFFKNTLLVVNLVMAVFLPAMSALTIKPNRNLLSRLSVGDTIQ
jgi:serine/threonine protein kinase